MQFDEQTYQLTDPGNFDRRAFAVGILALIISAIGFSTNPAQLFYSYLTAFGFWVTLGLGGLFFLLLHYLAGSLWSVVVRRIVEAILGVLPLMIILFLPIIFGVSQLYNWSDPNYVTGDVMLEHKAPYLNIFFFSLRTVLYFAIWFTLAYLLRKKSLEHDHSPSARIANRMRQISAPGMILFSLTLTFASFDWFMSLDAHWYSTIFGVYIFGGSFLSICALLVLFLQFLQRQGVLKNAITVEHYHDLGKYLFAFTIFWTYIAGSQYFLIWYGNIPEETNWFLHRWAGSWKGVSLTLVALHFIVPFLVLAFRSAKRNPKTLRGMAILILAMHWLDLYWIILPNLHHKGVHFSWLDLTTFVGIGGIFFGFFWMILKRHPLVPVNDPRLKQSIQFINR
ncbi:MAG: hypothetical protein ACE5D2_05960 [Fidelibacterota bacterium]